jgi:predicted alpha-1,2-mannosidase
VLRYGTFVGANGGSVAYFDFDPTQTNASVLTLRVATSLISLNQSQYSLDSEIGSKSFDDVALEGEDEWRLLLGRVTPTVDSGYYSAQEIDDQLTTFYSALYRASLFPRFLDEIAPDGSRLHFSAYDPQGGVFPGISVSDSGFWDAYRTVYPWLSLFSPKTYGRMVTGWTNAFHEGGWLPKWASPGYRGSMVGTMGDVSLADAIVKNIPGIDRDAAWAAIRKDAFDTPSASNRAAPASVRKQPEPLDDGFTSANDPGVGRTCLAPYLQYGYIPRNAVLPSGGTCSEVVSRSLNYMLADAAIAQAAHVLGHDDDAKVLMQRAANYSLLFDAATGFFRSRDAVSGNFTEPFDEFAWGGDYTEAGAWQYRFYVPHDVAGLRALYAESGLDLCDEVERAQTIPGVIHVGAYGTQIHEMTEMAQLCWGQYEHNNQPVHHMLWMPIAADTSVAGKCAQRAQRWLRRVTSTLYKPGADFACGDEDNGQMSAW